MNIQLFDYSVDLLQVILWQYNNSEKIQSLLSQKQDWYSVNQTQFWTDWYNNVFNLATANSFGLSVWSYILDIPLFISLNPDPVDKPVWGFNEIPTINSYQNFDNGNFTNSNGSITLSTEEQRLLLQLRYYQLISNGSINSINSFLNPLFIKTYGFGAWVLDGLDMTLTYVFNGNLPRNMFYILLQYDILPRPTAVGIKYVINPGSHWGFGSFNKNFENGGFIPLYLSNQYY